MTKMLRLFLPLVLIAAPAAAQETDSQIWTLGSASASLGDGVELGLETTARFGDRVVVENIS